MPFVPHTPESLLPRSDSKNSAATCKGITSTGRSCRRGLGKGSLSISSSTPANRRSSSTSATGVLAVVQDGDAAGATAFFCWQHKDQAERLVTARGGDDEAHTRLYPLQERSSIDTLVARLGVLGINEATPTKTSKTGRRTAERDAQRERRPPIWDTIHGPLIAVPDDMMQKASTQPKPTTQPVKKHQRRSFWASLCCVGESSDEDYIEVLHNQPSNAQIPSPARSLLSLIPHHLSPQTTSLLLTELAKPLSQHDDEGFIYIFWLTDTDVAPSKAAAASLLDAPSSACKQLSPAVLNDSSSDQRKSSRQKTMLLKIGRASNVQRRMNEWARQCGYNLTLVRFYPYVPSSPLRSPASAPMASARRPEIPTCPDSDQVRKVPHAHRVERLIHLELANKRVKRSCMTCGKEHREWFEVEASREGVKEIDEVVRRWVGWGERVT
ncbi:meiotically up-regulated gene 113-domain-containing protein [Cryomyces antarcticus]